MKIKNIFEGAYSANIYLSKANNRNIRKGVKYVESKRKTPERRQLCYSSVSIVDFEHVNVSWVRGVSAICSIEDFLFVIFCFCFIRYFNAKEEQINRITIKIIYCFLLLIFVFIYYCHLKLFFYRCFCSPRLIIFLKFLKQWSIYVKYTYYYVISKSQGI